MTLPETTLPDTTLLETTLPDTTLPETTLPDTTLPETTIPDTTLPESTIPDTTLPETTIPDTTVLDSTELLAGTTIKTSQSSVVDTAPATSPISVSSVRIILFYIYIVTLSDYLITIFCVCFNVI